MTKKAKTPARKGGAKKAAPPMRRKSKRASALPHVDVTAPKRKPIPAQVADGDLQARAGKAKAAEREFGKRPTVEEQFEAESRALPKAPAPKPGLLSRIWRAFTNREKANP